MINTDVKHGIIETTNQHSSYKRSKLGPTYNEFGYNEHPVKQVDFSALKSLTAVLKSLVTASTHL